MKITDVIYEEEGDMDIGQNNSKKKRLWHCICGLVGLVLIAWFFLFFGFFCISLIALGLPYIAAFGYCFLYGMELVAEHGWVSWYALGWVFVTLSFIIVPPIGCRI